MVPSVLAFVCWSLQCLISALTQGRGGGHFFRLTCSVAVWGGRDAANKQHWHVFAVSQPHWACPCSWRMCSPCPHCSGSRLTTGNHPRPALGGMHLPDLSHSGSGTLGSPQRHRLGWACVLCPSHVQAAQVIRCLESAVAVTYCLPRPCCSVFWVYNRCAFSGRC